MGKPEKKKNFLMNKHRYQRASEDAKKLASIHSRQADIEQVRQLLGSLTPDSPIEEFLAVWRAFEQVRTHPTPEEIANSPELAQQEYLFALAREFLAEKG